MNRAAIARFVEYQLYVREEKSYAYHYGLEEIKELLDFIHGERPKTENEKINGKTTVDRNRSGYYKYEKKWKKRWPLYYAAFQKWDRERREVHKK